MSSEEDDETRWILGEGGSTQNPSYEFHRPRAVKRYSPDSLVSQLCRIANSFVSLPSQKPKLLKRQKLLPILKLLPIAIAEEGGKIIETITNKTMEISQILPPSFSFLPFSRPIDNHNV